jgi:hypothetical protein
VDERGSGMISAERTSFFPLDKLQRTKVHRVISPFQLAGKEFGYAVTESSSAVASSQPNHLENGLISQHKIAI